MMHKVQWAVPSPLWRQAGDLDNPSRRAVFMRRPALLRFTTDDFIEELGRVLEVDPERLADFKALPETWRSPVQGAPPVPTPPSLPPAFKQRRIALIRTGRRTNPPPATAAAPSAPPTLKLYQPAHQRYYLVAASLVCRLPGLPDRTVDAAAQERVTFVLRRLVCPAGSGNAGDPETCQEYAFVSKAEGSGWQKVVRDGVLTSDVVVAGEEQLPMFPMAIADEKPRRHILAGLVPVGRREAYLGAPEVPPPPSALPAQPPTNSEAFPEPTDPRLVLFIADVISPWQAIVTQARAAMEQLKLANESPSSVLDPDDPTRILTRQQAIRRPVHAARDRIQVASWYALLDFANFLRDYLTDVWLAVKGEKPEFELGTAEGQLLTFLKGISYTTGSTTISLDTALKRIKEDGRDDRLEQTTTRFPENTTDWPDFRFALATIGPPVSPPLPAGVSLGFTDSLTSVDLRQLRQLVEAAVKEQATAVVPSTPAAARPPMTTTAPVRFVIRCVYERPRCGSVVPPVVSAPSEPFTFAPFFDPDAPARPIRIALPADTSPAALRKYQKNATFLISDVLCGQMNAVRKLTLADLVLSVLPWPFHKDLPSVETAPCSSGGVGLGMMCSLSIPIVTICALLLLMIIVSLLDFFFRWIPYFILCFPLPLKAKERT